MTNDGGSRWRWTLGLTLSLSVLGSAAVGLRSRGDGSAGPEVRRKKSAAPGAGEEGLAEAVLPVEAERAGPLPAEPRPGPSPEGRRTAWDLGYREGRSAGWDGPVSGQVVSPQGPVPGARVTVEWVAAFSPESSESARLKRGRAHRDRDGVWWSSASTVTDEQGCFSLEGLPGVQLRIRSGGKTVVGRPGAAVVVRLDES